MYAFDGATGVQQLLEDFFRCTFYASKFEEV